MFENVKDKLFNIYELEKELEDCKNEFKVTFIMLAIITIIIALILKTKELEYTTAFSISLFISCFIIWMYKLYNGSYVFEYFIMKKHVKTILNSRDLEKVRDALEYFRTYGGFYGDILKFEKIAKMLGWRYMDYGLYDNHLLSLINAEINRRNKEHNDKTLDKLKERMKRNGLLQ